MLFKTKKTESFPIPEIDEMVPPNLETATFALGWFWGPDAQFGTVKGIYRTRAGYTGGRKLNPTYRSLGNHTEAMQVDFDPSQISYEEIVDMVWQGHNPTRPAWSAQYMSAFWYENKAQLEVIEATSELQAKQYGQQIQTPILPLETFYIAEDYHQKYSLQKYRGLMKKFNGMYPTFSDFLNSTAAARLNGFVAGRGNKELFEAEGHLYGFSEDELKSALRRY